MATGAAWEGSDPGGKTTGIVLRLCVRTVISGPTNPEKNAGSSIKSVFIAGDMDTFQKCASRVQITSIVTRLRSNT